MYLFQRRLQIILICQALYLHSTMYLFQRGCFNKVCTNYLFTFHYVSISTRPGCLLSSLFLYLHSTMYLFQLLLVLVLLFLFYYLHSTMYLFQLKKNVLIIKIIRIYIPLCIYFNPLEIQTHIHNYEYLHSTMYLFQRSTKCTTFFLPVIYIPLCIYFNRLHRLSTVRLCVFTFHYVSISTCAAQQRF